MKPPSSYGFPTVFLWVCGHVPTDPRDLIDRHLAPSQGLHHDTLQSVNDLAGLLRLKGQFDEAPRNNMEPRLRLQFIHIHYTDITTHTHYIYI